MIYIGNPKVRIAAGAGNFFDAANRYGSLSELNRPRGREGPQLLLLLAS